ncbi:TOM (translocase of outer membrane) complex component [Entophlyctis sp. JEL0112]|nr:TOM (translocase of outer membrane) complex component [Entophlyctis sp. JEL0112]
MSEAAASAPSALNLSLTSPRSVVVGLLSVAAVATGVWILAGGLQQPLQQRKKPLPVQQSEQLKSDEKKGASAATPGSSAAASKKKKKKPAAVPEKETTAISMESMEEAAASASAEQAPIPAAPAVPIVQANVTATNASEEPKAVETPAQIAQVAKTTGNKLFSEKRYAEALAQYTLAISHVNNNAVFYANRAACHANLGDHLATIADCDKAIEIDPRYIKAIYRRAQAYTATGQLKNALNDYTAICMLEEFQKESSVAITDKVLKELGEERAKEVLKTKVLKLPSQTFVKAYMDSFRPSNFGAKIVSEFPSELPGDAKLHEAYESVIAKDWETAMQLLKECSALEFSSDKIHAFALNSYATFCFLTGDIDNAMALLDKSVALDPKNMNSLIKRASIFMERQDLESALRAYEKAESVSKNDPDLYYHRGQVRFLTGDITAAISDYTRSLQLDNDFVYAHIQLAVAQYKNGEQSLSLDTFSKALAKFPQSAEIVNYYGEVLLDMEKYADAEKNFDKAIELDSKSPLPYINKSILHLQWTRDPVTAEKFCRKATEVDPTCDIAYIQLAQLLIHQNMLEAALEAYDTAITVTRTEPELVNAISCREACAAQMYVAKQFPDVYAKLRGAAAAMSQ